MEYFKIPDKQYRLIGKSEEEFLYVINNVLDLNCRYKHVICIFDQYFLYPSGEYFGTDLIQELRDENFDGPIFIRSLKNSDIDIADYMMSGATDFLSLGSFDTLIYDLKIRFEFL